MNSHIVIFKTGKLYELDMASNLLSEKSIPFYKENVNSAGLRLAMPFQPIMGSGEWYSILVHKDIAENAKELLSTLPFEIKTEPSIWDFNENLKSKKGWKFSISLLLFVSALFFLKYFYGLILEINK